VLIGTSRVVLVVLKMSVAMQTHLINLIQISTKKTTISTAQGNQISDQVGRRQTITTLTAVTETGVATESPQLNLEDAIMINLNKGQIIITYVTKKNFTTQDDLCRLLMKSTFVRGVLKAIEIKGDLLVPP